MNANQITAAKTAELVAFFNTNAAAAGMKPVAKFADRKTAERRVAALVAALPKAAPTESATRSAGIANSWLNPEVKAARSERTNIMAGRKGKQMQYFRSVREAFRFFDLPDAKHIAFRMAFKAGQADEFDGVKFAVAAKDAA